MPRQAVEEEAGILTKITDTIKSYYDGFKGETLEEKVNSVPCGGGQGEPAPCQALAGQPAWGRGAYSAALISDWWLVTSFLCNPRYSIQVIKEHAYEFGISLEDTYRTQQPCMELQCIMVSVVDDHTWMNSLPEFLYWSPGMVCAGRADTDNCMVVGHLQRDGVRRPAAGPHLVPTGLQRPRPPLHLHQDVRLHSLGQRVMERYTPQDTTAPPPLTRTTTFL
ncbi:unnamed protein product [Lota lota]